MVGQAIESVLQQTYRPIEIILVDDGSDDGNTPQVLDNWADKHPDIIRVIHNKNGGPGLAREAGVDVLVEVHDEGELADALTTGATLVGVNNRDLHTFTTDLGTSERLRPLVGDERTFVTESGIHTPDDVARMQAAGINAFLVGEAFMRMYMLERACEEHCLVSSGEFCGLLPEGMSEFDCTEACQNAQAAAEEDPAALEDPVLLEETVRLMEARFNR